MWGEIESYFGRYPAQKKVATFLLEKGFQISESGKAVVGGIEVPHSRIASVLGVDRRVVDVTARRILDNERLREIYKNIDTVAFLRDVAPDLGLGVIVITASDASKPGIIGRVAGKIAEKGIAIRQAIADDPYFTKDPKLTIITEKGVGGDLLNELKEIEGIKKITIY